MMSKPKHYQFGFILAILFFLPFFIKAGSIGFEKSISINKTFTVSSLKSIANTHLLEDKKLEITNLTSNVLRSYQQDFDYRFYSNYQLKSKKESTFICLGSLVDRNYMNKRSKVYAFENGEYFMRLEIIDPNSQETLFGKSFIIDNFIEKGDVHDLTHQLQEALKMPLAMYFFNTSRVITANNNRLDSITFSINEIFTTNKDIDQSFLKKLTDLTGNALVMYQADRKTQHVEGEKYRFQYFRNYAQNRNAHRTSKCEIKGQVLFDQTNNIYTLNISLYTDKKKVQIPILLNPPIEFHEGEKNSYVQVALHIKQKIGLIMYYYFERYIKNQP